MDVVEFRPATADDRELLSMLIFRAWRWQHAWDEEAFRSHRAAIGDDSYVTGFGTQPGDSGVVVEVDDRPVGAAWCRLLAGVGARAGYVADDIPELAMAIIDDHQGRGLGRDLLSRLIEDARAAGHRALSLHVDDGNVRACRLYVSVGFLPVSRREHGDVLQLIL